MSENVSSLREVSRLIKDQNVKFLDLKFVDLPGSLQQNERQKNTRVTYPNNCRKYLDYGKAR